ncbi:unnamed protein product [marine sediment metagenome]|uniref:Uncharacterized protein n=1 Tax=marine sediment metagenome TaxID=412755 RepID=X1J000_9ZZZZ
MTSYVDNNEPLRIGIDGMVTPTIRTGVGRYLENMLLELRKSLSI